MGLDELADELGLSYHQTYHLALSVQPDAPKDPLTGEYILDETLLAAVRAEHERVCALHRRSMKAVEAAKRLGCADSTVYLQLRCCRLPLDPETDSSRAKFVPRDAVEAAVRIQEEAEHPSPVSSDFMSVAALARMTGLDRTRIDALVKAGHLEAVAVDRARAITMASIHRWAVGYRPDLLPKFASPE